MIDQFISTIPERPYCGTTGAYKILPKAAALRFPLIQFNHPRFRNWIGVDVDEPMAALAWEDAGLPPNLAMINPANGHGHLLYRLERPVYIDPMRAPPTPVRFLGAVQRGLVAGLRGDPAYNGLLVKNPAHSDWQTHSFRTAPYGLEELGRHLDLSIRPGVIAGDDVGRNHAIFETVRKFAYRVKSQCPNREEFSKSVMAECVAVNLSFAFPVGDRELSGIAKSISNWVWTRYIGKPKGVMTFLQSTPIVDRQKSGAKYVAKNKRERTIRLLEEARTKLGFGATQRNVTGETGLSIRTIKRYWNLLKRNEL